VKAGVHFYPGDRLLHVQDVGDVSESAPGFRWGRRWRGFAGLFFGFVGGVTHLDAHEEAVELRFRQRVSAVVLHGILCCDHEKRLRQRERAAVDGNLSFVHGFEESGLGARGGAINFVSQHDVGEDGPLPEFEFARFGIVDADAEHIAGQQVGSELDALESAMERFCERLGQGGFSGAGNVFDQEVAACQQG